MNLNRLILLLFFAPLIIITGCKKDPIEPDEPEQKDKWELTDAATMKLISAISYKVEFDGNDHLYAIQRYGGSSYTYCHCISQDDTWKRFAIDSVSSSGPKQTEVTHVSSDGYVWVLTDTRLIKVTSCGTFDSYAVVDRDTLPFGSFDLFDRFLDFEIINGVPWLIHGKWGLFHYDLDLNILVHHPIVNSFPFYADPSEIGGFRSLASDHEGHPLFSDRNGRGWVYFSSSGIQGIEYLFCHDCLYANFRTSPNGDVYAEITDVEGLTETRNFLDFSLRPTLPLNEAPTYFSKSVFDKNGYLAYYSNHPDYQPYIGLQPNGVGEKVVNARDAAEAGNVTVYHLAFNSKNELFAATELGVIKYLGKDE